MSAIDHHRRAHAALTRAHDLTPDSSGTTTKARFGAPLSFCSGSAEPL
jgi:hypothetical protein